MELVKEVGIKNTEDQSFYILKLDDLESKKFSNRFAVSSTKPSEDLLLREDTTKFLQTLIAERYEGLFQTELECMYHVRLYEAAMTIHRYKSMFGENEYIEAINPFKEKFE